MNIEELRLLSEFSVNNHELICMVISLEEQLESKDEYIKFLLQEINNLS